MRSLLRSSFLHRFAGGFALGAVVMLALQPESATAAVLAAIV